MRLQIDPIRPDALVAARAATQHGVITFEELLACGLTQAGIQRRVRAGLLHRLYRGVFAVGHPGLSAEGLRLAAVLACGEQAALSHVSAAAELGVRPRRGGLIDVTVPTRNGRAAPRGVRLHRVGELPVDEVIARGRLRLTSAARTFVDCSASLHPREIALMLDEAWPRHLIDWKAIERAMARPRPGVAPLRRVISGHVPGTTKTRTKAEERLRRLVLASVLPAPEVNVPLGPWEVDLLWRDWWLVVEVDSAGYHGSPWAQARDARKDEWLMERGFRVLRIPSRHPATQPELVVALIAAALRIGSS
ncbi:MAG: type IV toxin-antitoxin system AbiEi family antitoxin domain-containing protein [Solirubrobacteraceae bacterium]|nr:type IV toxin-antitoxin system AbiEi family antitoxin domain-containing protein [Solirubrobacteraceae bacterium]